MLEEGYSIRCLGCQHGDTLMYIEYVDYGKRYRVHPSGEISLLDSHEGDVQEAYVQCVCGEYLMQVRKGESEPWKTADLVLQGGVLVPREEP